MVDLSSKPVLSRLSVRGDVNSGEYYALSHLDRGAPTLSLNLLLITARPGVLFTEINISHVISLTMTLTIIRQSRSDEINNLQKVIQVTQ